MRIGVRDLLVLLLVVAVFGALMAWRRPPEPVATPTPPAPVVVTATPGGVTAMPVVVTPAPVAVKPRPPVRKRKPSAPPVYYPPPRERYKPYDYKPPNGKYVEGGDSLIVH